MIVNRIMYICVIKSPQHTEQHHRETTREIISEWDIMSQDKITQEIISKDDMEREVISQDKMTR